MVVTTSWILWFPISVGCSYFKKTRSSNDLQETEIADPEDLPFHLRTLRRLRWSTENASQKRFGENGYEFPLNRKRGNISVLLRPDAKFLKDLELPFGPDDESEPFFINCSPEFWSSLSETHWEVLIGWVGGANQGDAYGLINWDEKRATEIVRKLRRPHLEAILATNVGPKYLAHIFKYTLESELPSLDKSCLKVLLRFLVKDGQKISYQFQFTFSHLVCNFNGIVSKWHEYISDLIGIKLLERFIITEEGAFKSYLPKDFYTTDEAIHLFRQEGILVDGAQPFTFYSAPFYSAKLYGHLSPRSIKVLFAWFTGVFNVSKLFVPSLWRLDRLNFYLSKLSTVDCYSLFNTVDASLDILAWFFPFFNFRTVELASSCFVFNMDRLLTRFKRGIDEIDFVNGYYPLKLLGQFSYLLLECHATSIIPMVYPGMDRFGGHPADPMAEKDSLQLSDLCERPSVIIKIFHKKQYIVLGKAPFLPGKLPQYLKAIMKLSEQEHIELLVQWIKSLPDDEHSLIFKNIDASCFKWKCNDNIVRLLSHFLDRCDFSIFVDSALSSTQYYDLFIDVARGVEDKFGYDIFSGFPEEWYQVESNGVHALIFIIGQYYEFMSVPVEVLEIITKYYQDDGFDGSFASWVLLCNDLAGSYIEKQVERAESDIREARSRLPLLEADQLIAELSKSIRKVKRRQIRLRKLVASLPKIADKWPDESVLPRCSEIFERCRNVMLEIDGICSN
jgi:hypothetical protein